MAGTTAHTGSGAKRRGSPYATGGGGVALERRVGALFLAKLLSNASMPELDDRTIASVAFQQETVSPVDDLVIESARDSSGRAIRLAVASRRNPGFSASNPGAKELFVSLVRADMAAGVDPTREERLAIALAGHPADGRQVADLTRYAMMHPDASSFFKYFSVTGGVTKALRGRLEHVKSLVSNAIVVIGSEHPDAVTDRTWSLLCRLRILDLDLEPPTAADWESLTSLLRPWTVEKTPEAGRNLRHELDVLAGEYAQAAAVVNRSVLRRRVHAALDPGAHRTTQGWTHLMALDRAARATKCAFSGADHRSELRLPRAELRAELDEMLEVTRDNVLVRGEAGVGKTTLVLDAIGPGALRSGCQALAINLRHTSCVVSQLIAELSEPLDELLAGLDAPQRLLIIDSAEAALETHKDVFRYIQKSAEKAGVVLVVLAEEDSAGAVQQLMLAAGGPVAEFVVPGLSDAEIAATVAYFPNVRGVASDPKGHELLRRPAVLDLLGRSGEPSELLSLADAMAHVWEHLVRNGGIRGAGSADARERTMLDLAAYTLRTSEPDNYLGELDNDSVAGLRASGVLRPRQNYPWSVAPEFAHELLRTYAVARYLLTNRDLIGALRSVDVPRWALPSARMAAEILLSADDEALDHVTGRFERLQVGFDALVISGYSARWGDVPTEALLSVADPLPLIQDAWGFLSSNGLYGVKRILRVLRYWQARSGGLDAVSAGPVITQLFSVGTPAELDDEVRSLLDRWLTAQVRRGSGAGQSARITVRERICRTCSDSIADLGRTSPGNGDLGVEVGRRNQLDCAWIADAAITHLALLGPDLGSEGADLLRRVAAEDPSKLVYAVEVPFGGHALACYDPQLLVALMDAYYVEGEEEVEDRELRRRGLRNIGVREHADHGWGLPLSGAWRGPFLALLRADYSLGVAWINRLLNHAAGLRVRELSKRQPPGQRDHSYNHPLSISGQTQVYVGDSDVWSWYRGRGDGPYPCMSALQALELATDEQINDGVPVDSVAGALLTNARSIAMPAFVLGVLVRHLEAGTDTLDSFLAELHVWYMEFDRTLHEHGQPADNPRFNLAHVERRTWSLRDVAARLAFEARDERAAALRRLGEALVLQAVEELDDGGSRAALEIAAVRNWAAGLDADSYETIDLGDGGRIVQQIPNAESADALHDLNLNSIRLNAAYRLLNRHGHLRGGILGRDDGALAAGLQSDIEVARDLLENPPEGISSMLAGGPLGVAASALELSWDGSVVVPDEDLLWCGRVLIDAAQRVRQRTSDPCGIALPSLAADQAVGRGIPYLLLSGALALDVARDGKGEVNDALVTVLLGEFARKANDGGRAALAQSFDVIWAASCIPITERRCHHWVAYEVTTESYRECGAGKWDNATQTVSAFALGEAPLEELESLEGADILVDRLSPALRAMGAAAASSACCREDARDAVDVLLRAHRRGMLASRHGYGHDESDAVVASRAALWQACSGNDDAIVEHVRACVGSPRVLAVILQAINAVAEERRVFGDAAARLWPLIMRVVLDYEDETACVFSARTWGEYALESLVPHAAASRGCLTLEPGEESVLWRDLLSWAPEVDRWLAYAAGSRRAVDALVAAIAELEVSEQVGAGLSWIERVVGEAGGGCIDARALPIWLCNLKGDLVTVEQQTRWQRVVDLLVVGGNEQVAALCD